MNSIALIQDEIYLEHLKGIMHPERPERLRYIRKALEESGLSQKVLNLEPRLATAEEIAWVHTPRLIEEIRETQRESLHYFDGDTPATARSYESACLAAGGLLVALDSLFEGKCDQAFAFPRPPGHHAERDQAMGFCLFNNVAIAAEYALRQKGAKKVLIFDFDVHHGNGTQHSFEERSDVFYLSTHQYPFYPGTGSAEERGKREGEGYTLNLPLLTGCQDQTYLDLLKQRVWPTLLEYRPDFLILSAGFDAHRLDPLGGLNLTETAFSELAREVSRLQKQLSIPVLYALEGGYHLEALAKSVCAVVKEMITSSS